MHKVTIVTFDKSNIIFTIKNGNRALTLQRIESYMLNFYLLKSFLKYIATCIHSLKQRMFQCTCEVTTRSHASPLMDFVYSLAGH